MAKKRNEHQDLVSGIIAYENGEMNEEEERSFFEKNASKLVHLQGHYGRRLKAMGLIK